MKCQESFCLQKYKCLAQDCELTCCARWIIAVSKEDVELWKKKAPHLLRYIEEKTDENGEKKYTMKRDNTRTCACYLLDIKGCVIHRELGEDYLPNLCSYFPHLYKKINDTIFVSATLACPSVVKCCLEADKYDFQMTEVDKKYTRNDIADYSNENKNITIDQIKELHYKFLDIFSNDRYNVDEAMMIFVNVAFSAKNLDNSEIYKRFDNYLNCAIDILKEYQKETSYINPTYKILKTLDDIVSDTMVLDELQSMIDYAKQCFGINENEKISYENIVSIQEKYIGIRNRWKNEISKVLDTKLKNIVKGLISMEFLPFGCDKSNIVNKAVYICFQYLVIRTILMCEITSVIYATSNQNIRRIIAVICRMFYGKGTFSILKKISANGLDLNGVIEKMVIYY